MKKAISVLLCFVMVIGVFCSTPMTVFAVETSPLSFYSNSDNTGWIVSLYDNSFDGALVIPATLDDLPVLAIDDYAFDGGWYVTSITIPSTVVSIGEGALDGCSSLKEIIVDEANEYFTSIDGVLYNKDVTELIAFPSGMTGSYVMPETVESMILNPSACLEISSVTINRKIEEINVSGFKHSTKLTEINVSPENSVYSSENGVLFYKDKTTLLRCPAGKTGDYTVPESVTIIAQDAFYSSSLTTISVGGNVKKISDAAFSFSTMSDITLEEGIEYIGNDVFKCCINLIDVKIPSGVKYLGSAFNECYYIKNVEIGDNIGEISNNLFAEVKELETLTLGNNYENVSESAFNGLGGVKSLYIKDVESWIPVTCTNVFFMAENIYIDGKDITEITELSISKETDFTANPTLFRRLTSLTEFKIAEGAEDINYSVRDGVLYDSSITNIIKYPTAKTGEYVFPETVTTISAYAFYGAIGLTKIEIPDEVVFLNASMFANCSNLKSVVLPESVTEIPVGAFSNSGLTEITIPDAVQYINSSAFYNCQSLATVRMSKNIVNVHEFAFYECSIQDYYLSNEVVTKSIVSGVNATAIHFTDGVKEISSETFYSNKTIKEISFSDTVETIGSRAFANCRNLDIINFGTGLLEVGLEAFMNCTSLQKVNVKNLHFWCNVRFGDSEANPLYYAQNLYLNDVLVEELEIPNGVIAVEDYAFINCNAIKKIIIPESVKTLGSMAFSGITLEQLYIPGIEHWCEIDIKSDASLYIEEDVTEVFVNGEKVTELVIPDGVTKIPNSAFYGWCFLESVTFNNDVTEIGALAFANCKNIKEVNLPDTVKYIGSCAFSLCSSLQTLDLGSGVEDIMFCAFDGCTSLQKVVIPGSVKTMESYAFKNCSNLKEIVFGDGLVYVPDTVFSNCASIESITFGKNIQYLEESFYECPELKEIRVKDLASWCEMEKGYLSLSQIEKFYVNDELLEGELIIPEGVNRIADRSFLGYSLITSVTISDSVTEIGEYAFGECANLEKVTFGSGVKTLSGVFLYASDKLTEVIISEGVERIEKSVFSSLDNLAKITLPKSLKYVAAGAFDSSYLLRDVYYNSDLIDWMSIEFDGSTYPNFNGASLYLDGELLENLVVPEEFTEVPKYAFAGVKSIKSVEMHDNVETVSEGAFMYCSSINSLNFSENLTTIKDSAFENCSGLTEIDIPEGVSVLTRKVFANCKNLEKASLHNGLTEIGEETFYNCSKLSNLNVPKTVSNVGKNAFKKCGLTNVYGMAGTMAETIANSYNAQFIDVTTLFAAVGENKQNGVSVVTDGIMHTNVNELVETFSSYYEAKVLESSGTKFLGTGSVIGIYNETGCLVREIVVVVMGDLNGDGVCDALDCMLAELTKTSCMELEGEYLTAADYTEDSEIGLDDFQQIVNKALL